MKHLNKSRTMLLLMVLLTSLSTYAQNPMVGDGFGGRPGYSPTNISAGAGFGAAICGATKQAYLWGRAGYNRNNSTNYSSATPALINIPGNVRQIVPGTIMGAYITDNGNGYVFGQYTPYNNSLITNAYYVASNGIGYVAFVKTDGTVWLGGGNSTGFYGNGTTTTTCQLQNGVASSYCVAQMSGITTAKRVAVMEAVVAVLLADGTVKMSGQNGYFPPALVSSTNTPITVPGLSNIVDIKATRDNFFALTASGQVYAWGAPSCMGTGVSYNSSTLYMPTLITFPAGAAPIKALCAMDDTVNPGCIAIDDNGNAYAWGSNMSSRFGINYATNDYFISPKLIATNVRDATLSPDFSYIIKNDNTIWVAGGAGGVSGLPVFMNLPVTQPLSTGYEVYSYPTYTQMNPTAVGLCAITTFNGLPPCLAGTTAPALTPTTATNSCPTTTVDLTTLAISSTTPSGAKLIWSTHKTPTSAADTLTTAQKTAVSTAGKYYAMYSDASNSCYSPADSVTISITSCVTPFSASNPAAQTATTGASKTGNAATELAPTGGVSPYIYSDGAGDAACVAPSGATALTGLTVNSNGTYSYTAPTTAGTYYYCIKVCDSATPTASCAVKTYTLTVAAPVCTVTGLVPTIVKN